MPETEDRADRPFYTIMSIRTEGWPEGELIVGDQSLVVRGPFGELSVPFEGITKVIEGPGEGVSINVGRLRLAFRLRSYAERAVVKLLLENRVGEARRKIKG